MLPVPSRKRPNCSRRASGEDAIQVTAVPFLGVRGSWCFIR
jgi:hypothetical protein